MAMKRISILTIFVAATSALSSAVPTAFKNKILNNLTPEAKAEIYDTALTEIQAQAMGLADAAVEDFWAVRHDYAARPTTTECQALQTEFDTFRDHYTYFLTGPLAEIDSAGTSITDNLEKVIQLEEDLETVRDVTKTVKAILTGLTFLPVVGSVMNTAKTALTTFETTVISRSLPVVQNVNKLVEPVNDKVALYMEKNEVLATKLAMGETYFMEMVYYPLFFADQICPSATQDMCASSLQPVKSLNSEVGAVKNTIDTISDKLADMKEGLGTIGDFLGSKLWTDFVKFMNGAADFLSPFEALLNKRFCINFYFDRFCFTIGEALNTIGKLIGALANLVMKAIKKLIPAIELPIPTIDLSFVNEEMLALDFPAFPTFVDIPGFIDGCDLAEGQDPQDAAAFVNSLQQCFPIVFPTSPPQCSETYNKALIDATLVSMELKDAMDAATAAWEKKMAQYADVEKSVAAWGPAYHAQCSACTRLSCGNPQLCAGYVTKDRLYYEAWDLWAKKIEAEKQFAQAVEAAKAAAEYAALLAEYDWSSIGTYATAEVGRIMRERAAAASAVEAAKQDVIRASAQADVDGLSSVVDGADVEMDFDEYNVDLDEPVDAETAAFVEQLDRYSAVAEAQAAEMEAWTFYIPKRTRPQPITAKVSSIAATLRTNAAKFSLPTRTMTVSKVAKELKDLGLSNLVIDSEDPGYERLSTSCRNAQGLGGNKKVGVEACYQLCLANSNCVAFDSKDANTRRRQPFCYLKKACTGTAGTRGSGYLLRTQR